LDGWAPAFQKTLVSPFVKRIYHYVHPNTITIFALVTGVIAAVFVAVDLRFLGVFILLLSGYLDIVDGCVARMRNTSSSLGTVLDILSDRFVEAFIVIALYLRQPEMALIALLMMASMLVCVSSFLLVGIFSDKHSQKTFYYSPGLMERAEAFIFFIAMILLPSMTIVLGVVFVLLVLWTTFFRVFEFYRQTTVLK
ncbi:CDP-alcohol phosphatidyltransferase family protein, partial [Facilibium subflavum]|uniref:CDP-alcohol phosphatidyltransferase family protein n=1 Tax=Facilibium subflavum TaxID=2219058 RepID=UPI0013C362AB